MSKSYFDKWSEVIKNTPLKSREPLWEQAIKYLVDEGDMGPTMQYELTQANIQDMILEGHYGDSIHELLQEFGKWLLSAWGETRFYVCRFTDANELWLAYLMAVWHDMEWNGEKWENVG